MKVVTPIVGTGVKLNIHFEPFGEYHMADLDFSCLFFVSSKEKGIVIDKAEMEAVDNDNYVAMLDTTNMGVGAIRVLITALVPDDAFEGGYRTEIAEVLTDEIIYK